MSLEKSYKLLRGGVKLELAVLNSKLRRLPPGVPHSLFLCLTYRCQLRCTHCRYRQPAYRTAGGSGMPPALALLLLKRAAAAGIPRVIMFGGEPTLYGNLEKVVREASALGLFTEMDTNGLLLSTRKLSALSAAGLSALRISLHSASAAAHNRLQDSGSFPLVRGAVKRALESGFLVYLSSCLSGENAGAANIARLSALGKAWGAHGIRFLAHVSDKKPSGAGSPGIAAQIRKKGLETYARTCFEKAGAGRCAAQEGRTVFVGPDGAVRACPYAVKVLGRAGGGFPLGRRVSSRAGKMLPCARRS